MKIFKNSVLVLVFGLLIGLGTAHAATLPVGQAQIVRWTMGAYKAPAVSINVIKKVGSNPNRYDLVRTVSASTKNDGIGYWVPTYSDIGSVSIEVGCVATKVACKATTPLSQIAVVNSNRFANTASAFQALEAASNK